jgi:hypothetical protein
MYTYSSFQTSIKQNKKEQQSAQSVKNTFKMLAQKPWWD